MAEITDGERWRFMLSTSENVSSFRHLLTLLDMERGTVENFIHLTDRLIHERRPHD